MVCKLFSTHSLCVKLSKLILVKYFVLCMSKKRQDCVVSNAQCCCRISNDRQKSQRRRNTHDRSCFVLMNAIFLIYISYLYMILFVYFSFISFESVVKSLLFPSPAACDLCIYNHSKIPCVFIFIFISKHPKKIIWIALLLLLPAPQNSF